MRGLRMVATAETTPIERIPLQKDEGGGRKRPKVRTSTQPPHRCLNEHTAAPPLHSPHDKHHRCAACTAATPPLHSRTIVPPLHGPHSRPHRCAPVQKNKGTTKSCSPRFAIICDQSDFCRAYARVCPSGQLPYRYAQKPWLRVPRGSQPFRCSFPNPH